MRSAYQLASDTYSACLVAMPQCDTATLAVARAGTLLEQNVARVNEWQAAGYTVRDRDRFRSVVEQVTLSVDLRSATVVACVADGSRLVRPGAGPDGGDVIVDDTFTSGRDRLTVKKDDDGKWRVYEGVAEGPPSEVDVCPAG